MIPEEVAQPYGKHIFDPWGAWNVDENSLLQVFDVSFLSTIHPVRFCRSANSPKGSILSASVPLFLTKVSL